MSEPKGLVPVCSFCGAEKSPETPLIAGNNGHICQQCVTLAFQVISSWGSKKSVDTPELKTPVAIKDFLDQYIIGQDQAKRTLSVAVYNHYLRLRMQGQSTQEDMTLEAAGGGVDFEKSNIIMVGPSGSGKTLLVKTLAKIIGVPFVVGDATTLTQAGYVGEDVDSILKRLLEAAEGDVDQAKWGIVYIDEIDKLAKRGGGNAGVRDVSGEGVQQALLKMVEGSEFRLAKNGGRFDAERAAREGGVIAGVLQADELLDNIALFDLLAFFQLERHFRISFNRADTVDTGNGRNDDYVVAFED